MKAFFDAFFRPVYAHVLRMVGDVSQAEDLTQEVFVQIHAKVELYDAERDPLPWVFTIATNIIRSHWRHVGVRESKRTDDVPGEALADESATPIEAVGDDEARSRVATAVSRLPEELRQVVLLRSYEGLAFEAIAQTLELTEVAARKRYSRALARLRKDLGVITAEGGAS